MINGDNYGYNNGGTISVQTSSSVPNIGGAVSVVPFRSGFTTSTQYLRFDDDGIVSDGRAFSFSRRQEVYDENLLWLPDVALVGSSEGDSATFTGYDSINPTTPAYTGTIDTVVTIVSHGPLTTPLATFEDVIEVHTISISTNSRQEMRTDESTIWYARNFGPSAASGETIPGDDSGNGMNVGSVALDATAI